MQLMEHLKSEQDITCSEWSIQQAGFLIGRIQSENIGLDLLGLRDKIQEDNGPREISHTALTILQAAEELTILGYPPKNISLGHIVKSAEKLVENQPSFRISGILKVVKERYAKVIYRQRGPTTGELRKVVRRTPVMMLNINPDGSFTSMNPQILNILGYSEKETPSSILELVKPESRERLQDTIDRLMNGRGPGEAAHEYKALTKSGDEVPVWIVFGKMESENGDKSVVATVIDITERKRMEEQSIKSEALKSLGEMAAGIAHDFNNLLCPISGYAELLVSEKHVGTPERIGLGFEIQQAASRAKKLVSSILRASRKEDSRSQAYDINKLVEEVSSLLEALVKPPHKLTYDLWTHSSMCSEVQVQKVERVIINLITNALAALPNRGGEIKVRTYEVCIPEESNKRKCEISGRLINGPLNVLEITDTGEGIPQYVRDRMFDAFYTTKSEGAGTGLGLSMCKAILLENNAYLEIRTELDHGTTLRIYFPSYQKKIADQPECLR
ncbi:nitrogen regulation protein NR(II) [Patescibacteria group bacterium]